MNGQDKAFFFLKFSLMSHLPILLYIVVTDFLMPLNCFHLIQNTYCVFRQVKSGTIFDNFLITDDEEYAQKVGDEVWGVTKVS